jgi:hypothetical protein
MYTVEIEGQPFTMFYDIDQLENNRISGLTDAGKIEWLNHRVQILLARPATSAFYSLLERFAIKGKGFNFFCKTFEHYNRHQE